MSFYHCDQVCSHFMPSTPNKFIKKQRSSVMVREMDSSDSVSKQEVDQVFCSYLPKHPLTVVHMQLLQGCKESEISAQTQTLFMSSQILPFSMLLTLLMGPSALAERCSCCPIRIIIESAQSFTNSPAPRHLSSNYHGNHP